MSKVLVIGLDGVSWNILDSMIEQGLMPNLADLKKEYYYGDLESSVPPVTFPAWKCYSTGNDPSEMGVYWWMNADIKNKKFKINNSSSFKGKNIWDKIGEKGKKSIIMNMPGTYPAQKLNGIMISGPISPDMEKLVYPKKLISYLKDKEYYNFPAHKWTIEKEKVIKEVIEIHDTQTRVALDLMEDKEWDFFHFTFFLTDPVLHHFWRYKENKYKNEWDSFWSNLDKNIGKFINKITENTKIIFMSDHGMTKLKYQIYLNIFLINNKYLKLKQSSKLSKFMNYLPTIKISKFLNKFNLLNSIYNLLDRIGLSEFIQTGSEKGINAEIIDWDKTSAFCLSDMVGLIYINNKYLDKNKLKKEILSIKGPHNEKIFSEVIEGKKVYKNFNEHSPQLIAIPKEGYKVSPSITKNNVLEKDLNWSATHRPEGFWLTNFNTSFSNIYEIHSKVVDLIEGGVN